MYNPQYPLIQKLKIRTIEVIRACVNPQQKIAVASPFLLYNLWCGDFYEAGKIIDELKTLLEITQTSPAELIGFKLLESIYAWRCSDYKESFQIIADAQQMAEDSGVHILDCELYAQTCWTAIGAAELKVANQALSKAKAISQPARYSEKLHLQFIEIGLLLIQGKANYDSLRATREIIEGAQRMATPYPEAELRLLYTQMLIALGENEAAKREINWLMTFASAMTSFSLEYRTLLTSSDLAFLTGNEKEGKVYLQQALAIGQRHFYKNCQPYWRPQGLPLLMAKALEHNIEVKYVHYFIRENNLKAPSQAVINWPWPVQIFSLGRFSIRVDNQELLFKTKAPKKPLELLKCLIAHGNEGVTQITLIYQLWPELDGDAGRNAFDLALHRLRKLLISQTALIVQEGRLLLNPNEVWVDAWAFDRLCAALETGHHLKTLTNDAQQLLRLYRGHFLEGEDHAWSLICRERLNSKFIRHVGSLAEKLMALDVWDEVSALYRRAIEFDPLIEDFHYGLMRSYQAQGRIAEALAAYRHCKDMLSIMLGVKPSSQTEALYRSLKSAL